MVSLETIAIVGFILGPIARTIYAYLWKIRENPDMTFDKRYWITMVAALGTSFIAGLIELPMVIPNLPEGSVWFVFFSMFAQGFMVNDIINAPLDKIRSKEKIG